MALSVASRIAGAAILAIAITHAAQAQFSSGPPQRLVDQVEVLPHEDRLDVVVQFECSIRYLNHLPASEGRELHIQLLPMGDCGIGPLTQLASELAPVSDETGTVTSVRLESDAPGQMTLTLGFRSTQQYVIAQGADPRGLHIRLLKQAQGHAKVLVGQPPETADNYAINLESQPKPFDPAAIQLAQERVKLPVFVSEVVVVETKWYRLRAGPVQRRSDAEQALNRALPDYPRAWIAQGDDAVTSDANAPGGGASGEAPSLQRMGSDPPLEPRVLHELIATARASMAARDYPRAITILTQLQRQPEFPDRARAQELLGLSREKSGQLAHAKAEYEEYLRRYPQGEAAERIRARLRALRAATGPSGSLAGQGVSSSPTWQVNGGWGQMFRYDSTRFATGESTAGGGSANLSSSQQTTRQDALYNDLDLLVRRHDATVDTVLRVSAGYAKEFSADAFGDNRRLSLASIEAIDRALGLLVRLGRQVSYQDGILGTFDGAFLAYKLNAAWSLHAAAGYPVNQTSQSVQTTQRFGSLALDYAPPGRSWDADVFAAVQQYEGLSDRRATGFEARYLGRVASLVALLDYDVSFRSLNVASVLGTVQLPARWLVSVDAERRNSPVLATHNALIGQTDTSLAQLEQSFTLQQIQQLAKDRTPTTDNYTLTATAPLGERFHFAATVAAVRIGATPASGGVDAQPSTGPDLTYQVQLYGSNLWTSNDFNVFTATYGNTEIGKVEALSASTRFPLGGAWRIGPRLSIDRSLIAADASNELDILPSLLVDYQRGRRLLQLEVGGQNGKRDALQQSETTHRYYLSLAYRIGF